MRGHVYGGIFSIQKFHDEMNLGIPQPGKDVVLTTRSIWCYIFIGELSGSASPISRLKFDLVFTACKLFDSFQSAKLTILRGGMGHQHVLQDTQYR